MRVRVWDLPTRLAHWLIAALTAVSWVSASNDWMVWHKLSGYSMLSLVLFRIYWGCAGSTPSQFSNFVRGPRAVLRYTRAFLAGSGHAPALGHNPLGGWSALAMLSLLLTQSILGLFAVDEYGIEAGPLAAHVSFEVARRITELHGNVFDVLFLLICAHVIAVLAHLILRGENLILPMLTGVKRIRGSMPRFSFSAPRHAVLALIASALVVAVLVNAT